MADHVIELQMTHTKVQCGLRQVLGCAPTKFKDTLGRTRDGVQVIIVAGVMDCTVEDFHAMIASLHKDAPGPVTPIRGPLLIPGLFEDKG